jgi:hypothetical protein
VSEYLAGKGSKKTLFNKVFFVLFSLNRNFDRQKDGEDTHARQKKERFSLFCSR